VICLQSFRRVARDFWDETEGQDLIEYSLLLSFISLAAIGIMRNFGHTVTSLFSIIASALTSTAAAS
jgi:Flp pilus assembly pilin Flp